jgi:mono/diheme cytochrome c family protein
MRPAAALAVLAIAGLAVAAGYLIVGGANAPTGANPDDPRQVARGKTVYAAECASCHGARLEGQPNWRGRNPDGTLPAPPHDATGHTWHHPDAVLFAITKQGGQASAPAGFRSAMPAFGEKLDDSDIWAVLAYIKSLWPREIRERQAFLNDRYKAQGER